MPEASRAETSSSRWEWIDDNTSFRRVVDELGSASRYGIDTEFHRERTYFPHLALVQLHWEGVLVLVDPLAVDLSPLAAVLDGPGLAIAHAAEQDLAVLERACGTVPAQLFDTQLAAGFLGFRTPSLQSLVEQLLTQSLAKGDRLTDWTRRPLTTGQQEYAASDVAHLLALHDVLVERLQARGRLEWAAGECQELLGRARRGQEPETAWWRLKDARSLRGPTRGVAQELAAWREHRAATVDRPSRFVLSDLALQGIVHAQPRDEAALRSVRGLDGRGLTRGAVGEILAAIERGRRLPPEELRLPPVDTVDRRLRPAVTLVSAWIGQLAHDLDIDPALLATRADLVQFLRDDGRAKLGHGWRADLVGAPVRRLVSGAAALAFEPGTGELALEERSGRPIPIEAAE